MLRASGPLPTLSPLDAKTGGWPLWAEVASHRGVSRQAEKIRTEPASALTLYASTETPAALWALTVGLGH